MSKQKDRNTKRKIDTPLKKACTLIFRPASRQVSKQAGGRCKQAERQVGSQDKVNEWPRRAWDGIQIGGKGRERAQVKGRVGCRSPTIYLSELMTHITWTPTCVCVCAREKVLGEFHVGKS